MPISELNMQPGEESTLAASSDMFRPVEERLTVTDSLQGPERVGAVWLFKGKQKAVIRRRGEKNSEQGSTSDVPYIWQKRVFKAVYLPSKRIIPHQRIHEKKKSQTRADLSPRMFIITVLFIIAKYFKNLNVH